MSRWCQVSFFLSFLFFLLPPPSFPQSSPLSWPLPSFPFLSPSSPPPLSSASLVLYTDERDIRMVDINSTDETMATTENDTLRTAAILTAAICLIAMTTIIALVVTISVCCCYRHGNYRHHKSRRRRRSNQGDEELGQSDSRISFASSDCCEAIIPSGKRY